MPKIKEKTSKNSKTSLSIVIQSCDHPHKNDLIRVGILPGKFIIRCRKCFLGRFAQLVNFAPVNCLPEGLFFAQQEYSIPDRVDPDSLCFVACCPGKQFFNNLSDS